MTAAAAAGEGGPHGGRPAPQMELRRGAKQYGLRLPVPVPPRDPHAPPASVCKCKCTCAVAPRAGRPAAAAATRRRRIGAADTRGKSPAAPSRKSPAAPSTKAAAAQPPATPPAASLGRLVPPAGTSALLPQPKDRGECQAVSGYGAGTAIESPAASSWQLLSRRRAADRQGPIPDKRRHLPARAGLGR